MRALDYGYTASNWSNTDYFYIDVTAPTVDTIRANYVADNQIILIVKFKEDFYLDINKEPTVLVTHPFYPELGNPGPEDDSLLVEKQSFNGDEWTGILILPDSYSGRAIEVHVYGAKDDRQNIMAPVSIFKTPESIISQNGGTAISENGKVSLLLPQNAVLGDISISITGQDVPPDSSSYIYEVDKGITYLISDLYDIKPMNQSLKKPGILRINFPDSTCLITEELNQYFNINCNKADCSDLNGEWMATSNSNMTPFIGMVDTSISGVLPVLKLGGSKIAISGDSYMQVQIDTFGTYGAFVSMDTTLQSDSIDIEKIVCQPRIFSPKGGPGSVFEFTETNIIYSLDQAQNVTARIFNLSGRLKRTIEPEFSSQSGHQVMNWDGKDSNGNVVPSGLYIVTLEKDKDNTILRTTVGVLNR